MSLFTKQRRLGPPTEPAEWRTLRTDSGREFSVGRSITGKVLLRSREPSLEIEISVSREILPWLLGSLAALFPEPAAEPPGGTPNRPPDLKAAAAEAAQSPQEGAADESRFPEGSAGELAETIVAWADFSLAHMSEHEPTYWIKNLRLVGAKWLREHAETGREGSGRPPKIDWTPQDD